MVFKLVSDYKPTGDQPNAIKELTEGLAREDRAQVLLGVTGSGKTFTMANVIAKANRPTLILSHNKTLAAQLYEEMCSFFPENAVEYYVSYYDYYQPEAYLPTTDTYIEKDLAINTEIDRLRLKAVSALLSGRRDVVVVASVSCIYGMGGPAALSGSIIQIERGQDLDRNDFLRQLVAALYVRNDLDLQRGFFRVKGDTVDIAMPYSNNILRITWWGNEIDNIAELDAETYRHLHDFQQYQIYPANLFVTSKEQSSIALREIQVDLDAQIAHFQEIGDDEKAARIKERVEYDMEMIKELGVCSGIENYSRYFDGRSPGERPYCLLDFFPDDYLMFIDESHVSVPQIHAMYGGDRRRKQNLVEYGFRLPAAFDNRPLRFDEFQEMVYQVIYVSATPAEFEIEEAEGVVIEQVIRPTGLPDPVIEVRPSTNQIDDLMEEIQVRCQHGQRTLVTTLTKVNAEEMTQYLLDNGVRACYIHSDVATLDRVNILNGLRQGEFDVLVGVNLLREGLDLPEVSLVAIIDADKEGFLRNYRSLTQTAGRAARNTDGKVIMYADSITQSMEKTISETNRRREKQLKYNDEHGIVPRQIVKAVKSGLNTSTKNDAPSTFNISANKGSAKPDNKNQKTTKYPEYQFEDTLALVADPIEKRMSAKEISQRITTAEQLMKQAARELDFIQAAQIRDEIIRMKELLATMK